MRILSIAVALMFSGLAWGGEAGSPIKSPLALVAEARAGIEEISAAQLADRVSEASVLIDVREPHEYEEGHIPGAMNIPRGTLEFAVLDHPVLAAGAASDPDKLPETRIFLYCRSGKRAALAAQTLESMGFEQVFSLEGGYKAWREAGLPVE